MSSTIATVRVEHPDLPGQVMVINASDLSPEHKLVADVPAPAEPATPAPLEQQTVTQLKVAMTNRKLPVRRGYTREDMLAAIAAHDAAEQGAQLAGTAVFSLSKLTVPQGQGA